MVLKNVRDRIKRVHTIMPSARYICGLRISRDQKADSEAGKNMGKHEEPTVRRMQVYMYSTSTVVRFKPRLKTHQFRVNLLKYMVETPL